MPWPQASHCDGKTMQVKTHSHQHQPEGMQLQQVRRICHAWLDIKPWKISCVTSFSHAGFGEKHAKSSVRQIPKGLVYPVRTPTDLTKWIACMADRCDCNTAPAHSFTLIIMLALRSELSVWHIPEALSILCTDSYLLHDHRREGFMYTWQSELPVRQIWVTAMQPQHIHFNHAALA